MKRMRIEMPERVIALGRWRPGAALLGARGALGAIVAERSAPPVAPDERANAAQAAQRAQRAGPGATPIPWRRLHLTHTRVIALLASALSVAAFIWYYVNGYTLTFSDAVSHMMIARRVIFARTPGLGQLGSVWPPFNHLLMLPFVWIDPLYRSGLAGAIPSMVCYVLATVYLFRIARLVFSSALAGWVAAVIFAANPNVLYLQSTPMSELVLLGAIIVGLYYLVRWAQSDHPLDLLLCAAAFAAGTLVRYDAWALAGAELLVVAYITWRKHGPRAVEGTLWLYGLLAFLGCVGWFLYNWVLDGDPFYFLDGPYSASYQQKSFIERGALPTYHNLLISLREYAQAAADNIGWALLALAVVGLLVALLRYRLAPRMLPIYALWALTLFNILSLFLGITVIYTPQVHIPLATGYANLRYGVMVVPEVALFVASLVGWRRQLAVLGLALALLFSGLNPTLGLPYSLRDPLHSTDWAAARAQAHWLDQHYTGGAILIGGSSSTTLVFSTGLPDNDILNENTPADFNQAIAAPQNYVTWIVMDDSRQPVYDAVYARLSQRQDWRHYFVLRATIDGVRFYQRISPSGGS